MATVITKESGSIVTTVDGEVINVQTIRREDNVISAPPSGSSQVSIIYVDSNGQLIVLYDSNTLTIENISLPSSSIDNAIVRFDGITGKIIQGYTSDAPTISDAGIVFINGGLVIKTDTFLNFGPSLNDSVFKSDTTFDQLLLALGSNLGRQFVIGEYTYRASDFDHATPTNPTLFIHSATDPGTANTQWISLTHDQTDGVIEVGIGKIKLKSTVLLDENVGVELDPALSADGKYSGTTEVGTAGTDLVFGDIVYLDGVSSNNKWELTDADAEATAFGKIGIVVVAGDEDGAITVLLWGKVRADAVFPTLTIGAPVFVGLTAGDIVTTAPSATGDIVRIIGYGNTADELYFCPDNTYVEIA